MKDNSKVVALVLVVLTIIVLLITFISNKNGQTLKENNKVIVTNYSDFYTVNSCLYRTITYLSEKNKDALILLINDNYKKENKINKENVLELFSEVNLDSTFVSEKMYYESLTSSLEKYYVKGFIKENTISDDDILLKQDYESVYFIVYLDSSKNIFSIEPYDGKIFKVGDPNE